MSEKKQDEKTRVTLYLSPEGLRMLNELYTGRLLAGIKVDRSRVAFDALALLYAKEVKGVQSESVAAGSEQMGAAKRPPARKKAKE